MILSAPDGRAALETYRQHAGEVSIVLLDMTMPEMGGTEVLRELRRSRSELPVILCSGRGKEELELPADMMQRTAFLQKPFEHQTLVATIRGMVPGCGRDVARGD